MTSNENRIARWYFGGVASSMAAMVTHPLDLLKVLIQTQKDKLSIMGTTRKIVREQGVLGFYNGISASILRQYTYTLSRFGIYTAGSTLIDTSSMSTKILLAALGGGAGGLIGAPADLINVRMQNDVKMEPEKRRNYKHALDGLVRVGREEGFVSLFNGGTFAALRGSLMTVGQIAFYEQSKNILLSYGFPSRSETYILASIVAAVTATILTQPIDVAKTRMMNARPGEYSGMGDVFQKTALEGPLAFYKGSMPSLVRLAPHTVLLFLSLEYLRKNFGYLPDGKQQ